MLAKCRLLVLKRVDKAWSRIRGQREFISLEMNLSLFYTPRQLIESALKHPS